MKEGQLLLKAARVTIRLVTAVDRLTLTLTLNMTMCILFHKYCCQHVEFCIQLHVYCVK